MQPAHDHATDSPDRGAGLSMLRRGGRWLPWAGLGCVAAACLAVVDIRELAAQRPLRPMDDAGTLWISDSALDDSRRLLMVVDPGSAFFKALRGGGPSAPAKGK